MTNYYTIVYTADEDIISGITTEQNNIRKDLEKLLLFKGDTMISFEIMTFEEYKRRERNGMYDRT